MKTDQYCAAGQSVQCRIEKLQVTNVKYVLH